MDDPIKAEIVSIYKRTQKFLRLNKDLVVTSADKGNRTVVMSKSMYEQKMMEHLSDNKVYKKLDFDTTELLHGRSIYICQALKKQQFITDEEYDHMAMHNASAPKVYGQPKVHKRGNPLRLIVASYESPAYNIALFLTKILNNLTSNSKYNVRNATSFIDRILNTKLSLVCKMVSFDVVSLFTNIPLDLVEMIIENRWNEIEQFTTIPRPQFMQLLNFATRDCNQFTYKNTMYKQIDGLPMGLPLSPILADLVMEYVLDQAISMLNYQLKECVKYVDDLFLIIPSSMIEYTRDIFNSIHHKIQFTIVEETNHVLPFLDVLLIHGQDHSIHFDWYSKPTSSGRIMSYFSNHPLTHKLNVMDNLIKRLLELSSRNLHWKNTKLAKRILTENGYPTKLIDQRIKRFHWVKSRQNSTVNNQANVSQSSGTSRNINPQEPARYKALQFNSSCSQNIGKILCRGIDDVKLGYKPTMKNGSMFTKLKQKTPITGMYDVVYNLPCLGDGRRAKCNLRYIGQTGRKTLVRTDEHVEDIKAFNQNGELEGSTALVHHYYESGHVPDTENISILEVEHSYPKRRVLESLHIMTNPSMNFRKDTDNISSVYRSLIKSVKAPST